MTVPALAKAHYDVLNAVTLKKMADAPAIAAVCRLDQRIVEETLEELSGLGLVLVVDGNTFPSDTAETALVGSAAEHYAAARRDGDIQDLVEKFEAVNRQFLDTMSAWQQVDVGGRKVTNDHSDSEYDDKVITRIDRLVRRLVPLLDALAEHDTRFLVYRERFERSISDIDGGRHELVSSPETDSVHNIWFEFHEDLLRTLGRAREV